MSDNDIFKMATTSNSDCKEAIEELSDQLNPKEAQLTVLYVSSSYDIKHLNELMPSTFGKSIIACTTAGEISENGSQDESLSAMCFYGDSFQVSTISLTEIKNIDFNAAQELKDKYSEIMKKHLKAIPDGKTFSILLIDGMSVKEEVVTGIIAGSIEGTPLIGGSAGDALDFGSTYVYVDGQFIEDAATLTFITTDEPFEIFKVQHFNESDKKVVITESNPETRVVTEIDGEPAAESYARTLGIQISDFNPMVFSKYPLMLKIGEEYYVRSIQKVNPDNSLTFYCAIDDGLVLTLGNRESLVENIERLFINLKEKLGEISQCILFECILRKLEASDLSDSEQNKIKAMYKANNSMGFHTYGEQFGGLHINQTLTGVAFGQKK